MGYPKQPGQDAEAHRRVTEKCLAQTQMLRSIMHWLDAAVETNEKGVGGERLDWLAAFGTAYAPRIRKLLGLEEKRCDT